MKHKDEQFERLLCEANQAKERLATLSEKLMDAGYIRKSKSCVTLVYQIEEWQNRK